ncbi:PAS domain-containing protein [Neptunicella sp.]|uniref:PAS domain-containing protein n=1 Tax=Neptunicella sp. TaxID=2125986 RepID=UPI003F68D564
MKTQQGQLHIAAKVIIVSFFALLVSPMSYAAQGLIQQQSDDVIYIGLAVIAAVVMGLSIWILLIKSALKKSAQTQQQQATVLQDKQAQLDGAEQAILHLNAAGQVIYANQAIALVLKTDPKQLINRELTEVISLPETGKLVRVMSDGIAASEQIALADIGKHLVVGIRPAKDNHSELAFMVSIQDVTRLQQAKDQLQSELTFEQKLSAVAQLGHMNIDYQNNTVCVDQTFARLLQRPIPEVDGSLEQLQKLIVSDDWLSWKQALEQGKQGQPFELKCRFLTPDGVAYTQLYGLVQAQDEKGEVLQLRIRVQDLNQLAALEQQNAADQLKINSLLGANPHPMYFMDEQRKLVNCNAAFEKLFSTQLSQIRGCGIDELSFLPDDIKQQHNVDELMLMSMGGGMLKEIELRLAEDDLRSIRFKLQGYRRADGKMAGLIGLIEDISELKASQALLEQERQRFRQMLDLAPVAVAIIDQDDHIIQANNAFTERLGLSAKEMKKGSFYQLFNDPINSGKAAKQLHKTGKLRAFAADLKGAGEDLHPSELHIDLFDPDTQQYLCWISDISDKQFHQDKFEGLLQHSSMPMAVLNEDGFSKLNPAACEFFAIEDEDELFGLFPYSPELNTNQEAVEKLQQKLDKLRQDGQAQSLVWQHQRNEQALPCQATYVPMYKGQELDSILCIWMDMRAINQADEQRMAAINLQQAAERRVAEKQQLLESSQDQLASKVQSLTDTESKLQEVQQDLTQKQSKLSDLEQAHQDVTDNLQRLKQDYDQSRNLLAESQQTNAELEDQLQQSSVKVNALEKQRSQIADALQNSEQQYKRAQQELAESEATSDRLQQEQQQQQQKISEFVEQIEGLKSSIEQKDQQISQVSGQITTLQSQLASSGEAGEKLREQLLNQRKASELAEQQRRELEETCRRAQAELSGKARRIDHLQHEMQKFEEMSNQQKGDMEQQQKLLQQELEAKQQQLMETQQILDETKRQSEKEKVEKEQQQQQLQKMQEELAEVERRTAEQQMKIADADKHWQQQQQALQQELAAKQQQLQQTEQILNDAKQQTEAEKAEKAKQQKIFEKLQAELAEVEQRTAEQQQKMAESDQQWQQRQLELKRELEEKQQRLQQTQEQLDKTQQQSDAEKLQRMEQQQKFDQLKVELADVETRAVKQREMMEGSDEQWRQHHDEIEQQKKQLQQALQEAEKQNAAIQDQLKNSMQELQKAENQVTETLSGEQKLQAELEEARQQAEQLKQALQQREEQESKLQQQLEEQQKVLQDSEQNISSLEGEQKQLTEQLQAVREEYSTTQQSLSAQDSNQSQLAEQLKKLEQELQNSKQQLDSKENALQDAQKKLESSQAKLTEQEQALVAAHKAELEEAKLANQKDAKQAAKPIPEFAKLPMPESPDAWFALLPFLQNHASTEPLPVALNSLMDELQQATDKTNAAVEKEDAGQILINARKLVNIANKINSEPLTDLSTQLEAACKQGQVDSISIFWPNMRKSLQTTLRVIYSHLQI